jgi:hypothetical protein
VREIDISTPNSPNPFIEGGEKLIYRKNEVKPSSGILITTGLGFFLNSFSFNKVKSGISLRIGLFPLLKKNLTDKVLWDILKTTSIRSKI